MQSPAPRAMATRPRRPSPAPVPIRVIRGTTLALLATAAVAGYLAALALLMP